MMQAPMVPDIFGAWISSQGRVCRIMMMLLLARGQ